MPGVREWELCGVFSASSFCSLWSFHFATLSLLLGGHGCLSSSSEPSTALSSPLLSTLDTPGTRPHVMAHPSQQPSELYVCGTQYASVFPVPIDCVPLSVPKRVLSFANSQS